MASIVAGYRFPRTAVDAATSLVQLKHELAGNVAYDDSDVLCRIYKVEQVPRNVVRRALLVLETDKIKKHFAGLHEDIRDSTGPILDERKEMCERSMCSHLVR